TMAVFIPWDILFTEKGIWGFNSHYITGVRLMGLPIEEWLFFFTIPYACLFTYEAVKYYFSGDILRKYSRGFSAVLIIILISVAIAYHDKIYTLVTFSALAVFILFLHFFLRVNYLAKFYLSWFLVLPPFFIINGVLTGSFLHEPVVWYNNAENLGIRLFTIPVEDLFYGMLLLMLNVAIYERQSRRIKL
ncbi:MAG TPA: lycopene cyclase domain-containing protein, partial [Bacteroidales bacterium]|nr:lycopene cyclase domain-containing protein [Bacteroidales bacterium]